MKKIFIMLTVVALITTSCKKEDNSLVTTGTTIMTGLNMVPTNVSTGTAKMTYAYNERNRTFTYQVDFANLTDSCIQFGIARVSAGQVLPSATYQLFSYGNHAAIGAATISGTGNVTAVTIVNPGFNVSGTTVIVGKKWSANTAYAVGEQISSGALLYTVTAAGTTSTIAPVFITGTATDGTATLAYAGTAATFLATNTGGNITVLTIATAGSGYTTPPAISVGGYTIGGLQKNKTGTITGNFVVDGFSINIDDLKAGKYSAFIRTKSYFTGTNNAEVRGLIAF
jgi:hypothetical protein